MYLACDTTFAPICAKAPATVRKEVWAHLLVYNVVRTLLAPDLLSQASSAPGCSACE
jgi:hypothetical protein